MLQELSRDRLHLLRPRGSEEQRLPIWPDLAHNLADLRLEAHVQHPVSLVEHEVRNAPEIRRPALEEVDETSRRGDDNLDASSQLASLRALGSASIDARELDVGALSVLEPDLVRLQGKLASRGHNECDRTVAWLQIGLSVDVDDGWEHERKRLPRPGFSNVDAITTRQRDRPSLRLDGGRHSLQPVFFLHHVQDVVREGPLFESATRLGRVPPHDLNRPGCAVRIHFLVRHGGHRRMLLVEILLEVRCV
mmetsp:Transcript_58700/g.138349  ORF Transcript_58700/g.138349 Transcript_58700/m.138349 type:complete len:250 (-) Transcript_58700:86-835(-)